MSQETGDRSNGYDAIAADLIAGRDRSNVGVSTVRTWARSLPVGASILDLGCGHGVPISAALMDDGFMVYGVDASPHLRVLWPVSAGQCRLRSGRRFNFLRAHIRRHHCCGSNVPVACRSTTKANSSGCAGVEATRQVSIHSANAMPHVGRCVDRTSIAFAWR